MFRLAKNTLCFRRSKQVVSQTGQPSQTGINIKAGGESGGLPGGILQVFPYADGEGLYLLLDVLSPAKEGSPRNTAQGAFFATQEWGSPRSTTQGVFFATQEWGLPPTIAQVQRGHFGQNRWGKG